MSIKVRLALLLGFLLAGLLAALVWLRHLEHVELANLAANERDTRTQLLNHWIDFTGRALPQLAADTVQSDEAVQLLGQRDSEGARKKIELTLGSAGATGLWILRADGTTRLATVAPGETAGPFLLDPAEAATVIAETPSPRFFAERGAELWEICIRRLGANGTEWLAIGRRWDEAQLRALSQLSESAVTLRPPNQLAQPPADGSRIVLVRPLADWRGRPLRVLHLVHEAPEIQRAIQGDWRQAQVFVAFGLMLIAAVALALQSWVLRPLGLIGRSLANNDAQPAREVEREKSELGRVATLILSSFAQRQKLENEIAERARVQAELERSESTLRENLEMRARLGRDLHDGVIQSLYAAGMGLAGIRALLRPEQNEAAERLDQTRLALNETIHDVRNFIIGLEPEALKLQTFSQAVAALLEMMRGIRPYRSIVDIDDKLAVNLTLAQRVHALQIMREAVSNALRHGAASEIGVALRLRGGLVEVEVNDNGRGFDSSTPPPPGHGLSNFAQRARELGADLTVQSARGRGTTVKLVFPQSAP
ncbi:MAG TPA: histidine kinase [Opitutaceae bacterium]|nr:histidine kinase [Opitutaceae bacterium]